MPKKITNSFNIDNSAADVSKPSIFDRLIKEIDAKEIPTKYIDYIRIQYNDGNIVELTGEEISHPMPVNKEATWEHMEESFKKMKDVRIFINLTLLEEDVNQLIEDLLDNYC